MAKLLNVPEVSEYLGVSVATVRKWILERKVPFVKIGTAVRFDIEVIEGIRKNGLSNSSSQAPEEE